MERILQAIETIEVIEVPEGDRLQVHAAVSRFSALYERIRNAVDYKDEHLLRRAAIKRILGRQLILEHDAIVIATQLLRELIAAGYLPNNELPESLIDAASIRIEKYQRIAQLRIGSDAHLLWLRSVIAVELEELFVEARREKIFASFLYERLEDRIRVTNRTIDARELRLQTYIACHRMFLKADNDVLSYKLLRAHMAEWIHPETWIDGATPIAERLVGIERQIRLSLAHPLASRFQRAVKPWAVALNVLKDALTEKPGDAPALLQKPESLNKKINDVADRRYAEIRGRVRRGALRATIYLLVTKMLVAFLIEVPLEKLWYGEIAMTALLINLLLPPSLMIIVSLFIRVPGKENTHRIQSSIGTLLADKELPTREIRAPRPRRGFSRLFFGAVYLVMCIVTFGGIGLILSALDFTWLSAAIFYFFLCVVSFFAYRLRQGALEYVVIDGRERFSTVFFDFVSLPILRVGQWLSRSISHLNVFLFFLDFIIEAPLKIFLGVLEEWFAFMKEKKEELD